MPAEVRVATPGDRERILAISSQIWGGYDYVPQVLDEWLSGKNGELLVAALDGVVAAFSYRTWVADEHAWLQGIRTDTALRGRGTAKALTAASIDRAWAAGAKRIGLSTYIDNHASMHIAELFGFRRVASFVYLEGDLSPVSEPESSPTISLSDREAADFIARSSGFAIANRRFASGWKFLAFDWSPEAALSWAPYRIGVRRGGKVVSALCACSRSTGDCASERPAGMEVGFLSFLDGEPDHLATLLRRAAGDLGTSAWEAMVPKVGDRTAVALGALREAGLRSWSEFTEDVFVYELDRASNPPETALREGDA